MFAFRVQTESLNFWEWITVFFCLAKSDNSLLTRWLTTFPGS